MLESQPIQETLLLSPRPFDFDYVIKPNIRTKLTFSTTKQHEESINTTFLVVLENSTISLDRRKFISFRVGTMGSALIRCYMMQPMPNHDLNKDRELNIILNTSTTENINQFFVFLVLLKPDHDHNSQPIGKVIQYWISPSFITAESKKSGKPLTKTLTLTSREPIQFPITSSS